jgi:hypothetical protein
VLSSISGFAMPDKSSKLNALSPSGDPSRDNWYRYQYMRDMGHREFVDKARICEDYVAGIQWDPKDIKILSESGRPYLTINKILATVDHLVGEQLYSRSEIGFRPARGMANAEVADAISKTYMNVAQSNKMSWVRTDVFADGIVTGRGYFDARIDMNTNFMGDIVVKRENPELVMLDPDASEYDPETWSDVGRSSWVSLQDIRMLYGDRLANELAPIEPGYAPYDFSDDDFVRDGTFASKSSQGRRRAVAQTYFPYGVQKFYRLFERQFYHLVNASVFVDTVHGEIVPIPEVWTRDRIGYFMEQNPEVHVMRKMVRKIRWVVSSGPVTLHDSWSPYNYLTIIPFFPHFRQGRTHGVVEHLISPQKAFNKSRSQELHVINTSANSGWITEQDNVVNMTDHQLENRGAQTGLVIVVKNISGIEKINPNQIPTGLDRASYKAEEDMKNIAGVSDAQTGFAREDVSGKALKANQSAGSTSFAPLFDNLDRTDNLTGKRVLNLIQTFYTEPRLLHIFGTKPGQGDEAIVINEVTVEGEILNNLSLGEYGVVVTSEPDRDSFEESQFDHAVEMRKELGIEIPDPYMIRYSKLRDKEELLAAMDPKDPEQEQFDAEMDKATRLAELEVIRGEAQNKKADALLKSVRAASEKIKIEQGGNQGLSPELVGGAKVDMFKENQKYINATKLKNVEFMNSIGLMREQHLLDVRKERVAPKQLAAPKSTPAKRNSA